MTFGEKLKQARMNANMSQEELAAKMNVSRSAVAKWETDKGMPDVENLKSIAYILDISIDYLLDDGTKLDLSVTRETIDFEKYGKGRKKVIKDKIIRDRFPDAEILSLIAEEKLTKAEKVIDNTVVLFLTPFVDMFPFAKSINNLDNQFYLVNSGQKQFLVLVTKEYMEIRELATHVAGKIFEVGNYKFINCGPITYA